MMITKRSNTPLPPTVMPFESDEEIVKSVISGSIPSYSLESKLRDCHRAAAIRKETLQRMTGSSLVGLSLDGFYYESILGQCCEMPVGYVRIPVGIAGPLLLNGCEYSVPMATAEGRILVWGSPESGCPCRPEMEKEEMREREMTILPSIMANDHRALQQFP